MRKLSLPILLVAVLAVGVTAATVATAAPPTGPTATVANKRHCDRNYSGRCLRPNVSDYDCAGGSGNGPYYVRGPFRVVGTDHYGLDSDHDGTACKS
ncbi:MAG TPA: excalibur domain-containing protein [Conexibacter sp.]|nr:excalibur domain-containing protein [Conexibacter sp.]